MADKGNIVRDPTKYGQVATTCGASVPRRINTMAVSAVPWPLRAGRDNSVGNPTAPSFHLPVAMRYGPIPLALAAGARTISVDVKYAPSTMHSSRRPRLIIRAPNPSELGFTEVIVEAVSSAVFQTLEAEVPMAAAGVVEMFWENRYDAAGGPYGTYWDNVSIG